MVKIIKIIAEQGGIQNERTLAVDEKFLARDIVKALSRKIASVKGVNNGNK